MNNNNNQNIDQTPKGYELSETIEIPNDLQKIINGIIQEYRKMLDGIISNIDENMKYVINQSISQSLDLDKYDSNSSIMSVDLESSKIQIYSKKSDNTKEYTKDNTEENTEDSKSDSKSDNTESSIVDINSLKDKKEQK